jgi:MarR family transcriptional regulator, organic hydroperoxide resistance regulator
VADGEPNRSVRLAVYEGPEEARRRAWVQMVRTVYRIQRRVVTTLSGHDITLPQFDVLATLRFGQGVTQQELAERLLVTKGNVCGVLDRLERLGWVERRPDPADRRANRLYLTAAGRRKIGAVLPEHNALVIDAMRTFSDVDVRTLRRLLDQLEQANGGND